MRDVWLVQRHRLGWACYRSVGGKLEAYRLPGATKALTFPHQHAAAVWAKILNEQREAA